VADLPPLPPESEIVTARPVAAPQPACDAVAPHELTPLTALTARRARPPRLDLSMLSRGAAGLDLGLVLLTALILPILTPLLLRTMVGGADLGDVYPTHGILIVSKYLEALQVVALLAYLVYRHKLPPQSFGLQTSRLGTQVGWGALTLGGTYAAMLLGLIPVGILIYTMPQTQHDLTERAKFMQVLPVQSMWSSVMLLVPVAIHEEVLFRGLLVPYLRRLTGGWVLAVALSSLLFASLHITQGWLAVLQILPVGATLAIFYVLSRSLLAVILAHFAFDFLQFQLVRLIQPFLEKHAQELAGLIG